MKQGTDLESLAAELVRQAETKRDFIVSTQALVLRPDLNLEIGSEPPFTTSDLMHQQIAERLKIPIKYYRRMMEEDPELLATNVNNWFDRQPQRRMIRTLDHKARAFLSDSYRTLDNLDVAQAVLPVLTAAGATIESCAVTETRLYIKATLPGRERVLAAPPEALDAEGNVIWGQGHHTVETLSPAAIIRNSELGLGALDISPGTFKKGCTNLAIFTSEGARTVHVGSKVQGEGDVWQYLKDDTKKLADAAVMHKLRDVLEATLTGELFDKLVARENTARMDALPAAKLEPTIEEMTKRFTFTQDERDLVMANLVQGGELNRFGLAQAVTRASQESDDYDRATDLERAGGQIIELTPNDWKQIAA